MRAGPRGMLLGVILLLAAFFCGTEAEGRVMRPRRLLVGIFLMAAVFMRFPCEAEAHDWQMADAGWIQKHPTHSWCCGEQDCEMVAGRVSFDPNLGWRVYGLKGSIRERAVVPSMDGQPWACRDIEKNTIRCLFLPGAGQ